MRYDSSVQKNKAVASWGNGDLRAEAELPSRFLEWQIASRLDLFGQLLSEKTVRFLTSHLPVLASHRPGGGINLANKGVGLVPARHHLARYIELYKDTLSAIRNESWNASLPKRVKAAQELLQHPAHIDLCRLGSLEIFEGETFRNIRSHPAASLLYTAEGPEYLSFQVDVSARILGPGQPEYEFLRTSRLLFEHEHFHIAQPGYPWAYEFRVQEVRDKTPKRRGGPPLAVQPMCRH